MAIGIRQFEALPKTGGFVKADSGQPSAPLKTYGDSVFGRATAHLRDPGPESHGALKDDFKQALQQKYGFGFANTVGDRIEGGDRAKPLKASTVHAVLLEASAYAAKADLATKGREAGAAPKEMEAPQRTALQVGSSVGVSHSSFASEGELRSSADLFLRSAGFTPTGAEVCKSISAFANRPGENDGLLLDPGKNGGGSATRFMQALGSQAGSRDAMIAAANHPRIRVNVDIMEALQKVPPRKGGDVLQAGQFATPLYQFPAKFELFLREIASASQESKPGTMKGVATEMLAVTDKQLQKTEEAIRFLSDPFTMTEIPVGDQALLLKLRDQLVDVHAAMVDPKGVYQQMIAFAAVALDDPDAAMANVSRAISGQAQRTDAAPDISAPPTDLPPVFDDRPQPGVQTSAPDIAKGDAATRTSVALDGVAVSTQGDAKAETELRSAALEFARAASPSGGTGLAVFSDIAAFVGDPAKSQGLIQTSQEDAKGSASRLMLALAAMPGLAEKLKGFPPGTELSITVRVTERPARSDAAAPTSQSGQALALPPTTASRPLADEVDAFKTYAGLWKSASDLLSAAIASGNEGPIQTAAQDFLRLTDDHRSRVEDVASGIQTLKTGKTAEQLAVLADLERAVDALLAEMSAPKGAVEGGRALAQAALDDPAKAKALLP